MELLSSGKQYQSIFSTSCVQCATLGQTDAYVLMQCTSKIGILYHGAHLPLSLEKHQSIQCIIIPHKKQLRHQARYDGWRIESTHTLFVRGRHSIWSNHQWLHRVHLTLYQQPHCKTGRK